MGHPGPGLGRGNRGSHRGQCVVLTGFLRRESPISVTLEHDYSAQIFPECSDWALFLILKVQKNTKGKNHNSHFFGALKHTICVKNAEILPLSQEVNTVHLVPIFLDGQMRHLLIFFFFLTTIKKKDGILLAAWATSSPPSAEDGSERPAISPQGLLAKKASRGCASQPVRKGMFQTLITKLLTSSKSLHWANYYMNTKVQAT